jgi:hypothetical protein
MLRLLRRNEKESLRSRLLDGLVLYKAFQKPIREFEAEATGFRLSPEEVFWQVVVVLDKVKEYQEDALIDIRGLWDDIYVDYRDLSDDEDGLDLFTAITVFCVQTCLVMLNAPLYRTMASIIGEQLAKKDQPSHKMEAAVLNNITRIGTDKFKAAVQVYMNSEEDWLSDEIEEVLDTTPNIQQGIPQKKEDNETKAIQLTNRQLMILFDLFLNKGFSTEFCNQRALATLLSRVSGRSEGSIRQKIREGVDYEIEDVRNDVNLLVQLLEPIDNTLAKKMRNLIE